MGLAEFPHFLGQFQLPVFGSFLVLGSQTQYRIIRGHFYTERLAGAFQFQDKGEDGVVAAGAFLGGEGEVEIQHLQIDAGALGAGVDLVRAGHGGGFVGAGGAATVFPPLGVLSG
jgi:hypothetical protein